MSDDTSHELTIVIGQLAALRCDLEQIEHDDVRDRIDDISESLCKVRNAIELEDRGN